MRIARLGRHVALIVSSTGCTLFAAQLTAQTAAAVQLAFGYECDDRFVIRNDGQLAVNVEYTVQGNPERSALHLDAKQSVEVSSTSSAPVELWVNGKIAATERKGSRACAATTASPNVIVRSLDAGDYPAARDPAPAYSAPEVVYVPQPYYYPPYFYQPYYYPYYYGGFGSSVSVVWPFFGNFGAERREMRYGRRGSSGYGRPIRAAHPRGRR